MAYWKVYQFPFVWDNEGEGDAGGDAGGGDSGGGDSSFSKDEVDQMLASQKKQYTDQIRQIQQKQRELEEQNKSRSEQATELQKQLEQTRKSLMTKEELAAEERAALEKQNAEKIENLTGEASNWKNKFQNLLIEQEIVKAVGSDAVSPEQFLWFLSPKAAISDAVDDDGNPTGEFKVSIDLDGHTLSPEDTVKRMKENEKYYNLFKSNLKGGMGGGSAGKGSSMTPADLKNATPEEWARYRKDVLKMD